MLPLQAASTLSATQSATEASSSTRSASEAATTPVLPSPSESSSPSGVASASSTPLSPSCTNLVQDNGESDVDCGGPGGCALCVPGRICVYDSDCDESLSTTTGTVLLPGARDVVCDAASLRCTDVRGSRAAYNTSAGVPPPSAVAEACLELDAVPAAWLTSHVLAAVQTAIATTTPLTPPLAALGVIATRVMQGAGSGSSVRTNMTLLLITPAGSGLDSAAVASAFDAAGASLETAVAAGVAAALQEVCGA